MTRATAQLGIRGILILAVAGIAIVSYIARGFEPAITFGHFTTNGIDLRIDSRAWYNGVSVPSATWAMKDLNPGTDKFFNFPDIKPADFGCNVISLHVQKGNAWLCLDFKNLTSLDNGINDPEKKAGDTSTSTGELADALQFFGWLDNGDGKYQPGEKPLFGTSTKNASSVLNNKSYAIGDSKNGNSCKQNNARYVAMCWCAGTLSVDLNSGKMSCDGTKVGNLSQSDSMGLDVAIRAMSSDEDPKFLCNPTSPPPPPPPHEPKDPKECKNVGWKSCGDNKGRYFKSEQECTSYMTSRSREKKEDRHEH